MRYFSIFSGIGGFELGIKQGISNIRSLQRESTGRPGEHYGTQDKLLEWECVGYSETNKYAKQIYKRHFPTHKNFGDATNIVPREIPDFDLLVGGFPCQPFSVAGKRRGFNEARGTLFFNIVRILKDKRPRHFLLENVKGLLSHQHGQTFQTILRFLASMGYSIEWKVFNSKNYGVPQNRERVFIIGHLGEGPRRKVFYPWEEVATCNESRKDKKGILSHKTALTARQYASWNGNFVEEPKLRQIGRISDKDTMWGRVYAPDGLSVSIRALGGGAGAKSGLYDVEGRIRRLTPLECERLQGFPDNWTKYGVNEEGKEVVISDAQRYKTLGNAVTVNVVEAIITKMYGGIK